MIKIVATTADYRKAFPNVVDLPDEWYSADHILEHVLKLKRDELIKAYSDATGMSVDEITNDYEEGIDDWIGFGSVTCFELGCNTYVGFNGHDLVVCID